MAPLLIGFLLFAASLAAQDDIAPADEDRNPNVKKYIGKSEHVAAGKDLYAVMCSGCHGPSGEGGRGPKLVAGRAAQGKTPTKLYDSIKNGVPGGDMPPFTSVPEEQLWQMTAFVRSLSRPAYEIDIPGDASAGEKLFFGAAGCSKCHLILGKGGMLGPDLSNAGLRNYESQLREALYEPHKEITPGFDPVRVTLRSGKTIEGVAKSYTNYSWQVMDASGGLHLLDSRGVKKVVFLKESWMPGDLAERLSGEEIQNVLAYISRQTTRVPVSPGQDEEENK